MIVTPVTKKTDRCHDLKPLTNFVLFKQDADFRRLALINPKNFDIILENLR